MTVFKILSAKLIPEIKKLGKLQRKPKQYKKAIKAKEFTIKKNNIYPYTKI